MRYFVKTGTFLRNIKSFAIVATKQKFFRFFNKGQRTALAFSIDSNANFPDFHLGFHPFKYSLRQLVIYHCLRPHLNFL